MRKFFDGMKRYVTRRVVAIALAAAAGAVMQEMGVNRAVADTVINAIQVVVATGGE